MVSPSLLAVIALAAACDDLAGPTPVDDRVSAVQFAATTFSVAEGATAQAVVTLRDVGGAVVTGRAVRWSSSDASVAAVGDDGLVTGVRAGTARIAASAEGVSALATVTVLPRGVASVRVSPEAPRVLVGGFVQLGAEVRDEQGAPLAGRVVAWSSADSTIAAVDATGFVTGLTAGATIVTASSGGRSAAVVVTVDVVPVASVSVSPAEVTLVVGQRTLLEAVPRDSVGAPLAERRVDWRIDAAGAAIASVSGTGEVLALAPGTVEVIAESEGRTGRARVVVQPRPVGAVIVSPAQAGLVVGEQVTLTTVVTDASGNVLTGRPVTFRSTNPAVVQVDTTGVVAALAPGIATVVVESGGASGSARFEVTPSPVASVRVVPGTLTLAPGDSAAVRVDARDAAGAPVEPRSVQWLSGAPSVLQVGADGVVRAIAPGDGLVFALVEGRVASAAVTVRPPPVATVAVVPAAVTLALGATRQLAVEVRDSAGALLDGRAVRWRSASDARALVSSSGRVLALSPGTVEIIAEVDGVSGTSVVTVLPPPVASVRVTLAAAAVVVGGTTQATAELRDAGGRVITGRFVSWVTSDSAVVTVNANGVVTAVGTGTATITATSEGVSGTATVTVTPVPVATVTVTLTAATRVVGETTQATAELRDAGGAVLTGRAIAWTSSNDAVARVDANGVVTAVGAGTATITATSESVSGSAVVTVVDP